AGVERFDQPAGEAKERPEDQRRPELILAQRQPQLARREDRRVPGRAGEDAPRAVPIECAEQVEEVPSVERRVVAVSDTSLALREKSPERITDDDCSRQPAVEGTLPELGHAAV